MKAIKSIIILLVAIPAMAVYALFEAINALAIEIDLVRIVSRSLKLLSAM